MAHTINDLPLRYIPIIANDKLPIKDFKWKDQSFSEIESAEAINPKGNIAVMTGHEYGFMVIDVDVKKGARGMESLKILQEEHGIDFATYCVQTPSGGMHYYFSLEKPMKTRIGIMPGIDIKADGGYVLVPPSQIDGVYYRHNPMSGGELAKAPDLSFLLTNGDGHQPSQLLTKGLITEGYRDDELIRMGGSLVNRMRLGDAFAVLDIINERYCDPPKPKKSMERIKNQIMGFESSYIPSDSVQEKPSTHVEKPEESGNQLKIQLVSKQEVVRKITSVQWLVKGFLERDSFGVLFGESQAYKSFTLIDMAMCIATGTGWHGNPVKKGNVVYICGEGHAGMGKRLAAWEVHRGRPYDGEASLVITSGSVDLTNAEACMALKDSIDEIFEEAPVLIVVDTLARNFGGGNENSTQDMNTFINNVNGFLRAPYGCCLLVAHHVGHLEKERARGAYALYGATDFEYRAVRIDESESIVLMNTKMKDGAIPPNVLLESISVDLPLANEDGSPITSLAMSMNKDGPPKNIDSPENAYSRLGSVQQKILSRFEMLFEEMSKNLREQGRDPVDFVILAEWRKECQDIPRQRFHEAKSALVQRSILSIENGFVRKGKMY